MTSLYKSIQVQVNYILNFNKSIKLLTNLKHKSNNLAKDMIKDWKTFCVRNILRSIDFKGHLLVKFISNVIDYK